MDGNKVKELWGVVTADRDLIEWEKKWIGRSESLDWPGVGKYTDNQRVEDLRI